MLSKNAAPYIEGPHMLIVHFIKPMRVRARPVMSVMNIDISIALACNFICPTIFVMKAPVFVQTPFVLIQLVLKISLLKFLVYVDVIRM